jgi:predicted amidohydrolase
MQGIRIVAHVIGCTGQREDRISWGPTAVIEPSGAVASQLPLNEPGLLIFDLPIGS